MLTAWKDPVAGIKRAPRRGAAGGKAASRASACLALALACAGAGVLAACAAPAPHDALLMADGGRYRGALVDGLRSGPGRVDWENGAYYEGGFERGLYAGPGHLHSRAGEDYEGGFARGQFEGPGRLATDQAVFEGHFHAGQLDGSGTAVYADGRRYRGAFAAGRYQGQGRFETAGGAEVYEGQFADDEFTGEGSFTSKSAGTHVGHFAKWRPDGAGRYTDAEGDVYEGQFRGGSLDGPGVLRMHDGARYEGGFKSWLPDGQGMLLRANGDVYRGSFAMGVFEGEGTLIFARPRPDGKTQEQGTWHQGHLGAGGDEAAARANIELVLYNQSALLARRLADLRPRRADAINLYLLEVAGDGSQEVFRREVDFVQAQFDARFGTRGHSIQLINSRNTVAQAPLATVTSIRRAVAAIAARMDRERDILFVYLTSHGSRDHRLLLDLQGMTLPPLAAEELGRILRDSAIRWKVVVVSACYGGGFIEPLDDGHTLILAAARRDRRSFGCSDDNDFTYFGRAYFEQALPAAHSFEDAFARARVLIDEWEERDLRAVAPSARRAQAVDDPSGAASDVAEDDGHSLPQMRGSAAISAHLARWWSQFAPASAANGSR